MHFQLLRHATAVITLNRLNLLLDPMLSPKESMGPIANAANQSRIPMVDLPLTETELREEVTLPLAPGDVFVFCTDGVYEA